jgi:BMFP domain-containing protein YqiC
MSNSCSAPERTEPRKLGIVERVGDRFLRQGGEKRRKSLFPRRKGGTFDAVREQTVRRLCENGEWLCRNHGRHGREAESSAREKFREWMAGADFVGRDEFEAVKAMAAAARDENEILKARLAALEAKVAGPATGTAKRGGTSRGKAGA